MTNQPTNQSTNHNAPPVAVVDLLNSLLEAALNSVFRFMGEGSPYLSRAGAEVRKPLAEMVTANQRRANELAAALDSMGIVPTPSAGIRSEEQYLAFLSLKFLLPKLVSEKSMWIELYQNAIGAVVAFPQVPAEVPAMLKRHLGELRSELASLEHAAAHVGKSETSKRASGTKSTSDAGPSAG